MSVTALNDTLQEFSDALRKTSPELRERGQDWETIKRLSAKAADLFLLSTNQFTPPVELGPICELRHIEVKNESNARGRFGALQPRTHGFVVRVSSKDPEVVRRTTIAHEIGHTLFYDLSSGSPSRILQDLPQTQSGDKEEWICWDFARELLLPERMLRDKIENGVGPASLRYLLDLSTASFRVSPEFLSRRIMRDLHLWPHVAILICEFEEKKVVLRKSVTFVGELFPRLAIGGAKGILGKTPVRNLLSRSLESFSEAQAKIPISKERVASVRFLKYFDDPIRILGCISIR